jgi:hypothetical protein
MLHPYEYMTDAELYDYIRGVIDRTHGSLPTQAVSLPRADAGPERTQIVPADRRATAIRHGT